MEGRWKQETNDSIFVNIKLCETKPKHWFELLLVIAQLMYSPIMIYSYLFSLGYLRVEGVVNLLDTALLCLFDTYLQCSSKTS